MTDSKEPSEHIESGKDKNISDGQLSFDFENLENADLCEVRLIVATQPSQISGIPTKVPDVMPLPG